MKKEIDWWWWCCLIPARTQIGHKVHQWWPAVVIEGLEAKLEVIGVVERLRALV
jgi:hypothetical protein